MENNQGREGLGHLSVFHPADHDHGESQPAKRSWGKRVQKMFLFREELLVRAVDIKGQHFPSARRELNYIVIYSFISRPREWVLIFFLNHLSDVFRDSNENKK